MPNRTFLQGDWCNMEHLPDADLAICKDVLQHWCNADILKGLRRLAKYRWVLLTNSIILGTQSVNSDIVTGDVRPVDLSHEPFSLFATERHRYQVLANQEFDLKEIFLWEPGRPSASLRGG